MRIDVVGLPASGKSTFAEHLSRKLSIPHIHLDEFWFESGGKQGRKDTPNLEEVRAKVRKKIEAAISGDAWISDGIYLHSQDLIASRADRIIFLDIPLLTRMRGHFKRTFLEPKRHPYLSFWDDLTFFREMLRREFSSKPKLLDFIREHRDKVVILKSWREVNDYLNTI